MKKPYTFGSPVSEFSMDYVGELVGKRHCHQWRALHLLALAQRTRLYLRGKDSAERLAGIGHLADGQPVTEHTVAFDAGRDLLQHRRRHTQ